MRCGGVGGSRASSVLRFRCVLRGLAGLDVLPPAVRQVMSRTLYARRKKGGDVFVSVICKVMGEDLESSAKQRWMTMGRTEVKIAL